MATSFGQEDLFDAVGDGPKHRARELGAAALMGKENLEYLFSKLGGWFKRLAKSTGSR
jgi:hypothetical protein